MDKKHTVENLEEELEECCILMVNLLTQLKEKGVLSEEEYKEHIMLKMKLLKEFHKKD